MKACIFCGASPTTKEHLLPEWLAREIQASDLSVKWIRPDGTKSWRGPDESFGTTVRCACGENCNNGWMSRLEDEIRPILGPMATGRRRELPPVEQVVLAKWVWKTAIVSQATMRDEANWFVSRDQAAQFYQSGAAVPANVRMWLGGFIPRKQRTGFVRLEVHALTAGTSTQIGRSMTFTVAVGAVVLQVLAVRGGRRLRMRDSSASLHPHLDRAVAEFYPQRPDSVIAPKSAIESGHFMSYANRFAGLGVAEFV